MPTVWHRKLSPSQGWELVLLTAGGLCWCRLSHQASPTLLILVWLLLFLWILLSAAGTCEIHSSGIWQEFMSKISEYILWWGLALSPLVHSFAQLSPGPWQCMFVHLHLKWVQDWSATYQTHCEWMFPIDTAQPQDKPALYVWDLLRSPARSGSF